MDFEILGNITDIEIIAIGGKIRILPFLRQEFGRGRWRKLKRNARIKLGDGEIHWFEAHGIGKKFLRIKHYLE